MRAAAQTRLLHRQQSTARLEVRRGAGGLADKAKGAMRRGNVLPTLRRKMSALRPLWAAVSLWWGHHEIVRAADISDAQANELFENKIRPVLVEKCFECHSGDAKSLKANLLLDSREGLLRGGDTGAAIVPGDARNSLLIKALHSTDKIGRAHV